LADASPTRVDNSERPARAGLVAPVVRPATPEMAPGAAQLIYLTMGAVADYLFGADHADRATTVLGRLFRERSNLFSHQLADVVTLADTPVALVMASSWHTMQSLEIPTAYQLARAGGISGLIRMLIRSRPLLGVKEAEDDEYFVAHLAVLPAFEGQGLGRFLLSHAETKAVQAGFARIALTVEVDNERAVTLYLRSGFRIVETRTFPTLKEKIRYDGFHRMVKALA
jgi:ribosomal protein S18 acetylase RimI-like enzyme